MQNRFMFAVAALSAGAFVVPAQAAQVSLVASKDNTLFQDDEGDVSNGSGQHFFVGLSGPFLVNVRRGLLAFDVEAALPADAVITSVELRLHLSATISPGNTMDLHRMTADWGEGASDAPEEEGPGAAAEPGDATWLHAFYDDTLWSNPGGDFDATISASQFVGSEEGFYTWSAEGLVADVQSWIDNPGTNFGWILKGGETIEQSAKRFDSREHEEIAWRPTLTITYVPAPGAVALLGLGLLASRRRRRA